MSECCPQCYRARRFEADEQLLDLVECYNKQVKHVLYSSSIHAMETERHPGTLAGEIIIEQTAEYATLIFKNFTVLPTRLLDVLKSQMVATKLSMAILITPACE